jgi:uncharacterized OB-fold protein
MGVRCKSCGAVFVPPRPLCTACYADFMEWVELSGEGQLTGFTTVYTGLSAMIKSGYTRENPYCSGVVRLQEGPAISGQILDVDVAHPERIQIGTRVKATFIDRGEGEAKKTYLAFKPA